MTARLRSRDTWHWLWLSIADAAGVPLIDLGNVLLVDLQALHERNRH